MENKNPGIISTVGQSFDIILESMVGSTGYGWCLKTMPNGVELISTDTKSISPGIAPVRQIFTFAAIEPLKDGVMEFDLLCLFDLSRPIADSATYEVEIHDKDEDDPLKSVIGGQKFLKGAGAMVHAKPIPPYGFADSEKAVLLYGFPPAPLYGYPPPDSGPSVIESRTNCLLKYGNPFGVAVGEEECTIKYGFPAMKYGYPPVYKYGFPMTNIKGETLSVKEVGEDDPNCVVKYGTPNGVANTTKDCTIKYGFPEMKK